MWRCALMVVLALTAPGLVTPQEHAMGGAARPVAILPGLGDYHHAIATKSAEAQRFFDQGLTLIYAFNHEEALRSFLRAAELDQTSPMPVWGIALSVGPNYNLPINPQREGVAYKAIQEAQRLAAGAPEKERAYVDALARRYSAESHPDFQMLNRDYRDAMRKLTGLYPDDLDAATLYAESIMDLHAWSLWSPAGEPTEDTEELLAVLRSVLRRDPKHPGANHFYIHALEGSPHPETALASAHVLETLVPAAGHLLHMPSHIYVRLGNYPQAVKANEAAASADRAYLRATGMQDSLYGRMYYSHNLQFLWIAASMEGKFSEAKQAADELWANVSPAVRSMPMLEALLGGPALVLARFQRWDDILNLPAPEASLAGARAYWRYSRGLAFSAKGAISKAQAERQELAALVNQPTSGDSSGHNSGHNSVPGVASLALEVLDARIAAARADHKGALAHWRRAVEMQDALPYNEPPDWYYPVRESLGGELARAGQYAEAEAVFRADLQRNPGNPRSLFGLLQTLTAQNKVAASRSVRQRFEDAWKYAEVTLRLEDL
jgi:tetratricopeptide (TPR) repeat protein